MDSWAYVRRPSAVLIIVSSTQSDTDCLLDHRAAQIKDPGAIYEFRRRRQMRWREAEAFTVPHSLVPALKGLDEFEMMNPELKRHRVAGQWALTQVLSCTYLLQWPLPMHGRCDHELTVTPQTEAINGDRSAVSDSMPCDSLWPKDLAKKNVDFKAWFPHFSSHPYDPIIATNIYLNQS